MTELLDKVWDGVAGLMDDDTREKVHCEMAPCSNLDFLRRYLELDPDLPLHEIFGRTELRELDALLYPEE